jgi:hypothetical protein
VRYGVSTQEFEQLPLRVHDVMSGVPLHDVWAVDLPRASHGITLEEFVRAATSRRIPLSPIVRALFVIRAVAGRGLGLDRRPVTGPRDTFASRITAGDAIKSLAPPGTPVGRFSVVYRFENEHLVEVLNRTVHAAVVTALVESTAAYRLYVGVYVRSVGHLTPFYMALIGPFRKWIVYPSLLRTVRASWDELFGARSNS